MLTFGREQHPPSSTPSPGPHLVDIVSQVTSSGQTDAANSQHRGADGVPIGGVERTEKVPNGR